MITMRDLIQLVEAADDRFKQDAISGESARLFSAYQKKNKIDWRDNHSMEEWDRMRADAAANRHLYPIAKTDQAYLYHGTAKARLGPIAQSGLLPQEKTRWAKDGYAAHAVGRVFFADTSAPLNFTLVKLIKTRFSRSARTEFVMGR